MFKKLLPLLVPLILLLFPQSTLAFGKNAFVTISNPVRGYEGWSEPNQTPLDLPRFQYQESTHSAYPVTWLLRFDAVSSATISAYFADLFETDKNQSLGAFLEITPSLTAQAGVVYPPGTYMSNPNRIFLSGYSQKDRLKLIDTYMKAFFDRFGFYPTAVSAWDLDSYSLQYLQTRYSILTAMNCDDQYSTDHYRIWGGYVGSPYYPDKNNSLIPAASAKNRINLIMVRWAQRDLYNFYGTAGAFSYSVQVNDYLSYGLDTTYFEKLLAQYTQKGFNELSHINLGLENDYSLDLYQKEISSTYRLLEKNREKYNLEYVSLAELGNIVKAYYPESSPTYFYRTLDSTNRENGEVFWYQSYRYRIGLKTANGQTQIIDFRVYNREIYEDYFAVPNQTTDLYSEIPAIIDSVKTPGSELTLNIDLSQFKTTYDKQWDLWQITLENGNQKIYLLPDSIKFVNIVAPVIESADIKILNNKQETTWQASPHTPLKDYAQYSWLFWVVIFFFLVLLIKKIIKKGKPKIPSTLLFGFLCAFIVCLTVFRNGLNFSFGQGYFGPNGHDAIFHLSLIEKFSQNPLDLSHPQYAGEKLTNYHFVFDYFSGLLSWFFNIPASTLYFRFLPILFCFALVFLLDRLMEKWHYSKTTKIFGFLLVFFAGSFGFIPKLLTSQNVFSGESSFWANQSASIFLNPPYALSLIFLLLFLLNLPSEGKIKALQFIKLALLGGLLAQTKIYAFVLLCLALLFTRRLSILIVVGIIGALITLPLSSFSGSPFIFDPLWFPRSLFASYDRFYWPKFVEAWQAYEASGNFLKLFAVNLFSVLAFLVGNLGMRIFGFFSIAKDKNTDISRKIVSVIIVLGIVLPLFITQKINPWNTIQFMYYSLFFLGLFTAEYLSRLLSRFRTKTIAVFVITLFLLVATFTSIGTLKDYLGNTSPSRVSYPEMKALDTLKSKEKGVVLSPIYVKADWVAGPKPLYAYVSSAYISALSGQPEFLSDTINLDITGFQYQSRIRDIQRFYNTKDKVWANNFLQKNNIKYVYETPLQKITLNPYDLSLTKIYDSGEIKVYQKK
ncbi:MAG TPA: hypothetical protein PLI45_01980 [Candidatus Woesebacteria bacterium]|nr:hypothetical protein [Candidatus Woesebacteria bacterium]